MHVDGVGYLCSFAVFDFKKGTNVLSQAAPGRRDQAKQDLRTDYFSTKDGKMLASYYGFLDNYGANPQPTNRRPFHPPPTLPTLGSASAADFGAPPDLQARPAPTSAVPFGPQYLAGGSRLRPIGGLDSRSPAPSMLLDPHHQPSSIGFRPAARSTPHHHQHQRSRLAHSQHPGAGSIDDESQEDPGPAARQSAPHTGASSGGAGASDSLGDSWRMNPLGKDEDEADEGDEGENLDAIAGGAGVLGLIQQFQKANTEGRRTTVGI